MAGLIAALFGGHRNPNPNPQPGIGGYDYPRGPVGEGGFPGSTAAAPVTHPQSSEGRRERQLTAGQAQDEWKMLPRRQPSGMPRQPRARDKAQSDDTYRAYTPIIGANAPGAENVRNSVAQSYKAVPGQMHTYLSAPNPGKNGGTSSGNTDNGAVIGGNPTPVTVQSRWVSREGAQEDFAADRRIPYHIHARPMGYRGAPSNRGADLSGQRYVMAAQEETKYLPNGDYGIARRRGPNHRPIRFSPPGPWTANYYDEAPVTGTAAPDMVRRSPSRTKTKKPAAKSRANSPEQRLSPSSRGRVGRNPRRGHHG